MRRALASLSILSTCLLASLLASPLARADEPSSSSSPSSPPTEVNALATPLWALLQFIPSPETVIWDGKTRFGARWQVTPLLYSFGRNRRLSPWRSFLVEPVFRHSGSIEAYFSPEVLTGGFPKEGDRWIFRAGLRGYFPLIHKGDYLSGSVGSSLFAAKGTVGTGVDVGLSTLGGFFGLRVGHSPTPGLRMTTIAFEIRVF